METEQIDKRVTWLDEQRRKDAEHIARIHDRLDSFEERLDKQDSRLEEMTTELAKLAAVAARVRLFDDSLSKHREEVNKQLETIDERQISREAQMDSIRKSDQKQVSDSVEGMRARLKEIDELSQSLEIRRQEEMRLNRSMDSLGGELKKLSESIAGHGQDVAALQGNRKRDSKRISELESRDLELTKRIEGVRGPLDAVEDQIGKLKSKSSELERSHAEMRRAQTVWSEQQAVRIAEFERQWKGWEKDYHGFVERARGIDQKLEGYQETFRDLVRLQDKLEGVTEAIERRITEVGEIQRLNAERFKEEWAGFQADDQKRWSSFKLSSDELWRDHNRAHDKLNGQLQSMQADLEDAIAGLAELSRSSKQRLLETIALVRDWGSDIGEAD